MSRYFVSRFHPDQVSSKRVFRPRLSNLNNPSQIRPLRTSFKAAMAAVNGDSNGDSQNGLDQLIVELQIPTFKSHETSYPALNPVDIYRCYITDQVAKVSGVDPKLIYPALTWTNTLDKGDLMLAVPRLQVKDAKPADKASEWADAIPATTMIKKPEVFNNISLRFDFNPDVVPSLILPRIFAQGDQYGLNKNIGLRDENDPSSGRKRIIVEFSSPNIAKEFHVGHLRSTIIGAFLANLYEAVGWDVTRMNYLGDWGRQYGLLAVGFQKHGNEEAFQKDPIAHLFEVYVKINAEFKPEEEAYKEAKKRGEDTAQRENEGLLGASKGYFKRMEEHDPEALALWNRFRSISIEKFKAAYARLNIYFADYSGESTVQQETMLEAERILKERGITEFDNGATIIDFKKHGAKKLEVAIVRNRNGTSNYLLRDVGAAIQRWRKYGMDAMIYVVMAEQDVHLKRLFKILELMGDPYTTWSKNMQHVTFGKIKGMSTRKGTIKSLSDVLNDIGSSMHDVMRGNQDKYAQVPDPDRVADLLGMSSIMVQDMSGKRINNYPFELERMTSFEGDTGPYLQYAHARLSSIARKTGYTREQLRNANFSLLKEKHAIDLCRLMASWPDTLLHTYRTLEPTTVVTYLFRLTHQLSSSYDVLQVIGASEGPEVSIARAALYEAARQVLYNGLILLGLTPVDRM